MAGADPFAINAEQGTLSTYHVQTADLFIECKKAENLNLFAALLMGDAMEEMFPETHVAYWALLVNAAQSGERELRYALGLPRGFAKTTLIKLFLCWLIIYTDHRFFLVVSSTLDLAKNVLFDIVEFMSTPNFRGVYGNWDTKVESETKEDVRFRFRGKFIILKAIGAESSIRGVNVDNERPSVIICEDSQTRESAESEVQNKKFIAWFLGTLLKARSYRRSFVIYIGNMYNEQCLLNQLKNNPRWISLITSAILADGTSIWPRFRTIESLLGDYEEDKSLGNEHIFLAEVMNDPKAFMGRHFDMSRAPEYQFSLDDNENFVAGHFIIIDPATGKKKGDNTAIGIVGVINGKAVIREVVADKWGDEATVKEAIKLMVKWRCSLILVEDVAYQSTLENYFRRELQLMKIYTVHVAGIKPGGLAKEKRISNGMGKFFKGEIDIHPNARPIIFAQAVKYNPLIKDNDDDVLDIVGYADPALAEHWDKIYLNGPQEDSTDVANVPSEEVTCSF